MQTYIATPGWGVVSKLGMTRIPFLSVAALAALLCSLATPALCLSVTKPASLDWDGATWVALDTLLAPDFIDGETTITNWHRDIHTTTPAGKVVIYEGGLFYSHDDGYTTTPLRRPLLVIEGNHYVEMSDGVAVYGYSASHTTSGLTLQYGDRELPLRPQNLSSPHYRKRVSGLTPVNRGLTLTADVPALRNLHDEEDSRVTLPAGGHYLARRQFIMGGVPHTLVTETSESLHSYVLESAALDAASTEAPTDETFLGKTFARLGELAETRDGLYHGNRADLQESVAVTIDFCWSLRAWETDFMHFITDNTTGTLPRHITLLMSGRWIEQHPEEMARLIALEHNPNVELTWAQHSFDHPKEGAFMNAWSPRALQQDTLRLESLMLDWGIVPSVYYRFPGLIHDSARLHAAVDLTMIALDCDSWVSSMDSDRAPTRRLARHGSILLLHGNGNEPKGITRMLRWIGEHPDWKWENVNRFVPGFNTPPDERQTTSSRADRPSREDRQTTSGLEHKLPLRR